jgi:serine/threonine protein kinase/WD40 repeat protein
LIPESTRAACPSFEQLQTLLEDGPRGGDPSVAEHLEQCSACQSVLDRLTSLADESVDVTASLDGSLNESHLRRMRSLLAADAPAAAEQEQAVNGGPPIPGYEVGRELGRGGMAVVYEGRHLRLNRSVAIKMLRDHRATAEQIVRFCAEAEIIASLRHPNIVQVYEVGAHARHPYFALELMEGGTLTDAIGGKAIPPRFAAAAAETLSRAVDYAHLRGILHRDIKPSNILLDAPVREPADLAERTLKVTDFGLAKPVGVEAGLTAPGGFMGTPHYFAPEQAMARADKVTVATDVYALGATLFEMLTGRPPFPEASAAVVLQSVLNELPAFPRLEGTSRIPRDLQAICLKCLEKEPDRRYPSASSLADDLRRFLDGKPTIGRPVGPVGQAWRSVRRWPVISALIGGIVLTLIGGATTSTYFAIVANHRAQKARQEEAIANTAQQAFARQSADLLLDRGVQLASNGRLSEGLSWMLSALKVAPESDLGKLARVDLATWARQSPELVSWIPAGTSESAISPDGTTVATTDKPVGQSSDDCVRLRFWNAHTGEPAGPEMATPDAAVGQMRFSPDGRFLVAVNGSAQRYQYQPGWARIWDVRGQRPIARVEGGSDAVTGVAWLGPERFAIAGLDGWIGFFSATDGKPFRPPIKTDAAVRSIAASTDGRWLACVSPKLLQVVGVDQQIAGEPIHSDDEILTASFSRDGDVLFVITQVATTEGNKLATIAFDPATGQLKQVTRTTAVNQSTLTVLDEGGLSIRSDCSADGREWLERLDGLRVWRSARPLTLDVGRAAWPLESLSAVFAAGGTLGWRAGDNGQRLQLLDGVTGSPVGAGVLFGTSAVSFAPATGAGGSLVALVLPTTPTHPVATTAQVFDTLTGHPVGPPLEQVNTIISLDFSPDGRLLAYGGHAHVVDVRDLKTGKPVGPSLQQDDMIDRLKFSPDGSKLAVATYGRQVRLWDVRSWKQLMTPLPHEGPVWGVWFNPSGDRLVATDDRQACVWETATGRLVARLPFDHESSLLRRTRASRALFSRDGHVLLMTDGLGTARLWDGRDGRPLGRPLTPPPARGFIEPSPFDISSDGAWVVATFEDGIAQLWQVSTCRPWAAPIAVADGPCDVRFDPDSRSFRVLCANGEVRHFPIPPCPPTTVADADQQIARRIAACSDAVGGLVPLTREQWLSLSKSDRQ